MAYEPRADRLVIPVYASNGDFCEDILRNFKQGEKRYVHAGRPGHVLYGLYFQQNLIRNRARMIITEGFADAIALRKFEQPVVASLSSALSVVQRQLALAYTKNVFVLGDDDTAGRWFAHSWDEAMGVVISGHDPASALAAGFDYRKFDARLQKMRASFRFVEFGVGWFD